MPIRTDVRANQPMDNHNPIPRAEEHLITKGGPHSNRCQHQVTRSSTLPTPVESSNPRHWHIWTRGPASHKRAHPLTRGLLQLGGVATQESRLIHTHNDTNSQDTHTCALIHHTHAHTHILLHACPHPHTITRYRATANMVLNGQFVWPLQSTDLHTPPRVMGTPAKMLFPSYHKCTQSCSREDTHFRHFHFPCLLTVLPFPQDSLLEEMSCAFFMATWMSVWLFHLANMEKSTGGIDIPLDRCI